MFRNMKRANRKLPDETTLELLINGEYGVLSTVGSDGYPYSTPLNYVYWNNAIYIHSTTDGHKLDNIIFNPKVSFAVVAYEKVLPVKFSMAYKSIVIFGQASLLVQEELKKNILVSFLNKYSINYKSKGMEYLDMAIAKSTVIEISIEHISGRGRTE
ncbi:pyridoxamine 5'-phosphate oxidase family protein [Clostridium oryzae]|uniref:Pyridoxamine 5'-phosphate oxidase n=1 Tax=Clostridium oryzae TaxID=1450648 RepID=A0A1V4IKD3_9CLOT|nr:pyridoxamine 5'-phosphate oxidase family protein [Clostridium oryzae]OPJ60498.1 pyridoxamine 5'-phosphate oxidase [Clostridium oryzae]